jgi:hypothetical protein
MTTTTESQITSGKAERIDIEKLRELALKATKGPWQFSRESWNVSTPDCSLDICVYRPTLEDGETDDPNNFTGEFIAAANPAAILALIDRIAHIETVREKDREGMVERQAFEAMTADRNAYRDRAEKAEATVNEMASLILDQQIQLADRDHFKAIAERQAAGLSKRDPVADGQAYWETRKHDFFGHMTEREITVECFKHLYAILSPAQQEPAKEGCSKCGSTSIHACPGAPIPQWTPEKVAELNAALSKYETDPVAASATDTAHPLADLIANQKPLDADIQKIIFDNLDKLYVTDTSQATPEGGISIQDLIAEHEKDTRKKAALDRARGRRATLEGGQLPDDIEELIGQYWNIAYSEGKTGISRGSEAQEVLSAMRAAVALYRAAPLQQVEKDN